MKRFTIVVAAMVAVAAMAGLANLASAGDYHVGRLLVCSDCHMPHSSQTHPYYSDADSTILPNPKMGTAPFAHLLRGETINNACLTCHDGKAGTIDVLMGNTNTASQPHGRSAGALNVMTGGAHGYMPEDPYTEGDGHSLWSPKSPPGWDGTQVAGTADLVSSEGLECTDCHGAHGNKYFRNMLGAAANGTATYFSGKWRGTEVEYEIAGVPTYPLAKWVLEKSPRNYDNDNVQYIEKDQNSSEYGKWCQTCHTTFHGSLTSSNMLTADGEVGRHPTMGVDMASGTPAKAFTSWAITDPTHRLKVMSSNGAWANLAANMAPDMTPSCFTCHKSHGNANKFGLIFVMSNRPAGSNGLAGSNAPAGSNAMLMDPIASANMTEQGDGGQYRDLCRNCHGQGSWPLTAGGTGNPTNIIP
jgi:hypothetical protein